MQRITNENIRVKIKKSIEQEDIDGNTTNMNMNNYNQFNENNIDTIYIT